MKWTSFPMGGRVLGLGVVAMGLVSLRLGNFLVAQPVPKDLPGRIILAYAAGLLMLAAGMSVMWRRTVAWGAGALAVYFLLIVAGLMNGPVILANYRHYGTFFGIAEGLAIGGAALIVYAAHAGIDVMLAARLTRLVQMIFGGCALFFGGAHFVYMNLTAPLVPSWLPPSQEFWGYATGIGHIAAGIAILIGVRAHLATVLLTVMYASFTPLVHLPMLVADSANRMTWNENAINLALTGAAWVVADSLARRRPNEV